MTVKCKDCVHSCEPNYDPEYHPGHRLICTFTMPPHIQTFHNSGGQSFVNHNDSCDLGRGEEQ